MARRDDVDRPAAVETPSPRRDGREPPEAAPTEEALATLQRLRETRPDLDADLDQVIATVEHLQLEVSGLRFALVARATIDAAKGILIAEHGCDEDAAFAILRRLSQDTNVPLRDVARAIVYAAQKPAREPGDPDSPGPTGQRPGVLS
jgi:hypothetical protein